MGMGKLMMYGVLGLGAMGAGSFFEGQQEEKAVAKYALNTEQASFMKECKSSMSREKVKFKEGANTTSGCACIVSKISPDLTDSQMAVASETLNEVFKLGVEPSTKKQMTMVKNFMEIQQKHNLNNEQSEYVIKKVMSSFSYCSKNA